jgi:hypothetical protein
MQPAVSGQRYPVNAGILNLQFKTIDNATGAPTGANGFSTFAGKVFLDDPNFMGSGLLEETYENRTQIVDGGVGIVFQTTPWDHGRRGHRKGFVVTTRADLFKVRQLLYLLRGKLTSFWVPTFSDDLTVVTSLTTSDKMEIDHIGYARHIRNRSPMNVIRVTFTDETSLIRTIISSTELSSTVEELTLNASWPTARTVEEIVRVEFLQKVRIDEDAINIEHSPQVGKARIFFPVRALINE